MLLGNFVNDCGLTILIAFIVLAVLLNAAIKFVTKTEAGKEAGKAGASALLGWFFGKK